MAEFIFSNFKILVQEGCNNRLLTPKDITPLIEEGNFKIEHRDIVYDITSSFVEEKYLWLTFKYGNPNPCPSQVLDKNNFEYQNNTRTSNLVEMRHQFFLLYDFESDIVYLSQPKKKSFIEELLKEKLNLGITLGTIFLDIDVFESKIKKLKSIKFTSHDNLFNLNSALNNAFKDLLGYGANIDFKIEINCKNKPLDKGSIITNLKNRVNNQEVRDLVIIGENENNFEQIFNSGTFNKKIAININVNNENLVDEATILNILLDRIKNV